jgi:glycosyltransferase involved in cell wall biosynthesis
MKILVVHEYYRQAGGEDSVFRLETELLCSRGHDTLAYTVHNDDVSARGRLALAMETVWNHDVYQDLTALLQRERVDLMHVHNTLPLLSPSVYNAAYAVGVPVVQTLHNYRPLCANGLLSRAGAVCEDCLRSPFPWRGAVRGCYRDSRSASTVIATMVATHRLMGTWRNRIDAYIAPSEFTRNKFIEGGFDGSRIHVKPHFVHPDPGVGDGSGRYAIYVGRLSREKGVLTLLHAWQQLHGSVPLVIVGDGPLASVVSEVAKQSANIRWLGTAEPARVYDLIGQAACAIVPSECYETFGRVVVEAFAKGTPVIGSDVGALAESVRDGEAGFQFRMRDPNHLAAVVRRLFDQSPLEMRKAARAAFESTFSAAKNYETLLEIYRGAVDRSRPNVTPAAVPRSSARPAATAPVATVVSGSAVRFH